MSRKPAFFWLALFFGIALLGYYALSLPLIIRDGGLRRDRGWSSERGADGKIAVVSVAPSGPAAGALAPGDRIVAINGDPRVASPVSSLAHLVGVLPGDTYTLRIERSGVALEPTLTMGQSRDRPGRLGKLSLFFLSASFWGTALLLGLLRSADRHARLVAVAAFAAAASLLASALPYTTLAGGRRALADVLWAVSSFSPALMYHGYYSLPPGIRLGRGGWAWLKRLFYAWGGALFVCVNLRKLLEVGGAATVVGFAYSHPGLWRVRTAVEGAAIPLNAGTALAALAVLGRNWHAVENEDQRRRIRWWAYGTTVGMLPLTLVLVFAAAAGALGRPALLESAGFQWTGALAMLLAFAIPFSFGYALLKHDILDVRIVIRRGVQYLLARNVLRLALLLPALVLVADIARDPRRTIAQILLESGAAPLLLLAFLALASRERLTRWVDRKFFREAYEEERILLSLIGEIERRDSIAGLSRLVSDQLEAALHPDSVRVFFLQPTEGAYNLEYSSGGDARLKVASDSGLARALAARPGARDLPWSEGALSNEESEWLSRLGAALAVPAGGGERRLAGFLLLGPKKSEEPYSPRDRRLLEAVAAQLAIACENALLQRKVDEEGHVRRAVLARLGEDVNLLKECPACGRCFDRAEAACPADGAALQLSLPVERTIDGRYRLDRLLGKGGMGAVYEATDVRLGRPVALKVMLGSSFGNEAALRRFEREARAAARLRHPNIVVVHDYGTLGTDGAYLVMERLTGATLRTELRAPGGLVPQTAAAWLDQMLEGVKAAHASGVIHRDLKPENVFLASDPGGSVVKVLDFGLAKLTLPDGDPESLTAAGSVLGTLAYMSPEQLTGKPVDHRTDIFALGVMLAECLTGRHPFQAGDSLQTMTAVLQREVRLPGEAPEVRALDDLLQRCLAKDREARFDSVAEMQGLVVPALRRCPSLWGAATPGPDAQTATRG